MKHTVNLYLAVGAVGLLAVLLLLAAGAGPAARAEGNLLKVPTDYPTIQAAIDAAEEGDTVAVALDSQAYAENLSISKGITLSGGWNITFTQQYPGESVIDGQRLGRVISITCPSSDTVVTIDGFGIINGDASGMGVPVAPAVPASLELPYSSQTAPAARDADTRSPAERAAHLRAGLADLAARGEYPGGESAYQAMIARLERLTVRAQEAQTHAYASPGLGPDQPLQGAGSGGGIYSYNASLEVRNCWFQSNVASQDGTGLGGGIYVAQAPPGGVYIASNSIAGSVAVANGMGQGGGLHVSQAPGATIGGNALEGNVASYQGNGYGGGIYVTQSPGAYIQDNELYENLGSNAGVASEGYGGGVAVVSSPGVLVRNNQAERNYASASWHGALGAGGGLYLHSADGAVLRDNQLLDNVATLRNNGGGGGLLLIASRDALVSDNHVIGNWGSMMLGTFGEAGAGGIGLDNVYSATVSGNEIRENSACVVGAAAASGAGGGVAGSYLSGPVRFIDNRLTANVACQVDCDWGGFGGGMDILAAEDVLVADNTFTENVASLLDGPGLGGGLQMRDTSGSQVLRNRFLGNRAGVGLGSAGGGLNMDKSQGGVHESEVGHNLSATIDANLFVDNLGSPERAMISLGGASAIGGFDVFKGGFAFTNNVLTGNQASVGDGLWLGGNKGGTLTNNTLTGGSDIGIFVWLYNTPALTLTNNIVVSHTVGVSLMKGITCPVVMDYTLWHDVDTEIAGGDLYSQTNPVYGDPSFADPAHHDFHLTMGSAAINAGDPAGVPPAPPEDADGVARPVGAAVDLGAYEWQGYWQHLPLAGRNYRPSTGWAGGEAVDGYGTIIHTTNGGATWERQGTAAEIPNAKLGGTYAVDAQNAWVVGSEATILRTRDGGRSWELQGVPDEVADAELCGVYAVDGDTAWAGGARFGTDPSVILHTADGGQTWTRQAQDLALQSQLCGVYAADAEHAWVVGDSEPGNEYGTIVRTSDGGTTWERMPYTLDRESSYPLISVHGVDADTVWAVGHNQVIHTADGGLTWIDQKSSGILDINGVFAVDRSTVWIVVDNGGIYRSEDGGASWEQQAIPLGLGGDYVLRISAVDTQTAWAVTSPDPRFPAKPGHVLRTSDGGQTWVTQTLPVTPAFWGVSFVK